MERDMTVGLTDHRINAPWLAGAAPVAILLAVAGGAWLASARLAMPQMRLGVLTRAAMLAAGDSMGMSGASSMGMSGAASMGLSYFIAAWTVMMAAMMLPSLVPAVRAFDAWTRATGRSRGAAPLFIAGYLLVWSAIGGVAYSIVQALDGWLPAGSMTALRIGAVLLLFAGLYQLTPGKQACLRQCQSPRMRAQALGHLGALRAGLGQGAYCLGSSWPWMLALLLVGMMNLAWMGVVAAVIFVEKVVPRGDAAGKVLGGALAGWGFILLAAPHALPALGAG